MSFKILPAAVAAILLGATALASAQTNAPYAGNGASYSRTYQQNPYAGTYADGVVPYNSTAPNLAPDAFSFYGAPGLGYPDNRGYSGER